MGVICGPPQVLVSRLGEGVTEPCNRPPGYYVNIALSTASNAPATLDQLGNYVDRAALSNGPSVKIVELNNYIPVVMTKFADTSKQIATTALQTTRWAISTLRQPHPGIDPIAPGVPNLKIPGVSQMFRESAKTLPASLAALLFDIGDDEDDYIKWFKKYGSKVAAILADRMPSLDIIHHFKIPKPLFAPLTAAVMEAKARYNKFMRNETVFHNADTAKGPKAKGAAAGIVGRVAGAFRAAGGLVARFTGDPNRPIAFLYDGGSDPKLKYG